MDIRKIHNELKAVTGKVSASGKEGACPFSEVLNSVVGNKTEVSACAGISGPQPLSPFESNPDPRVYGISKGDEVLKLLDTYSTALGDENTSLRDIGPMLDSLKNLTDKVGEAAMFLPKDDPLRKILDEARIIATVERMKFDRGDYI